MNCKNIKGQTPLHLASSHGHEEVVKILINNDAQVDLKDLRGFTALYIASYNGHAAVVHLLITHGADVDSTTPNGSTPLMAASGQVGGGLLIFYKLNANIYLINAC